MVRTTRSDEVTKWRSDKVQSQTMAVSRPAFSLCHSATLPLCHLLLFAVFLVAAGCGSTRDPALAGTEYPADKAQTRTLDIQVVRTETTIRLTNTTARAYGKSRLWINRWFSREIDGLGVGQTIELAQSSFRDQYGEEFRSGGFFATRKPQRVELVQLETADGMLGLVAVGKETE